MKNWVRLKPVWERLDSMEGQSFILSFILHWAMEF